MWQTFDNKDQLKRWKVHDNVPIPARLDGTECGSDGLLSPRHSLATGRLLTMLRVRSGKQQNAAWTLQKKTIVEMQLDAAGEIQLSGLGPWPFWLKLRLDTSVPPFLLCSLFRKMDDDVATLLARTHATLVRQLSEIAGHHFEGLQAAGRYKSLNLSNRHRKELCHLDIAFNWSRHVTSVKRATLTAEIMKRVSPAPAATCAATATPAPVNEYVAPAPTVFYMQHQRL